MGFMEPQVYKDSFFRVETTAGTEIVPSDVLGRTMSTHVDAMLDYLEGTPLDSDALIECEEGYVARMSAPGYLDCTAWVAFSTAEEARDYLQEMYGDEEE